jgi:hypothetical protein
MNPNDAIRQDLLRYFYDRNQKATSRFGKKGSAVKISDAKRELKAQYGLTQQQVMSNLTYLLDRQWVKELHSEKQVQTRAGTTIPSVSHWYEIAALGIERIEGESEFKPKEKYAGINVTATGQNVIALGDGNVVNVSYSQLHQELEKLKDAVTTDSNLDDAEKLDIAVDIESIKDQLAKPRPDSRVITHLWHGVKTAVTAGHFIELVMKISALIGPLLNR